MDQHTSVISLLIVVTAAFLTPILLHRLKLDFIPVVVAEILMGLVIGESGLNLVHQDMWIETLSTLGFIFLMFLSGLEIDFTLFSGSNRRKKRANGRVEPNPFLVSMFIFSGIFLISLVLSFLFVKAGFIQNAYLMTMIISTISLGVVVPTLKEAHIMKTAIGQIILLVAVMADLVTMILLALFVSLHESNGGKTWLLLVLFAAGICLYFIGKRFKNRTYIEAMSTGTIQIGTRAVFTLIIVLVGLSETVGAENILGAFLAGALVSLLSPNQELIHKLDSFGYGFLIPIFFVMVGVNINLWTLFQDKKLIVLIPLLLFGLFLSKLLPVYILRIWYDFKTVMASGSLLTSTLSLVIAAVTIGERLNIIDAKMGGTLILAAVITSIIAPVLFKKLFPREESTNKTLKVAFVGANQITLPVSRELKSGLYSTVMYHTKIEKVEKQMANSLFAISEIEDYSLETMETTEVFHADIVVISTGDEEVNATLAVGVKEKGVPRVITRIESPDLEAGLREQKVEVFSSFMSTKALLRAVIESPSILAILTNQENALYEIRMQNEQFEGMSLRRFPFIGDIIFVRIFRGKDSIVPHGDTELELDDRLIVTGSKEYADQLKRELEFCESC